jgi:hypothetical protein
MSFFPSRDPFILMLNNYMSVEDVFSMDLVSKEWQNALVVSEVWNGLYQRELIPLVEGEKRNLRSDLKKLYPITLNGAKIEKYLGDFVGAMPRIRNDCFRMLFNSDPDEPDKKMGESYEVIVVPEALRRTFVSGLVAAVKNGKLTITENLNSAPNEQELLIPFSFPNLVTLSQYPRAGQKNCPVFANVTNIVLDQCRGSATKVSIFFMRRKMIKTGVDQTYWYHEIVAKKKGLEILPLLPQALSSTIRVLDLGTDLREYYWDTACTSDTVQHNQKSTHLVISGYAAGRGINVHVDPIEYVSIFADPVGPDGATPGIDAAVKKE